MKTTIILKTIHCKKTSESGHDEVYVKYAADGGKYHRFPDGAESYYALEDGEDWNDINLPLEFSNNVIVELYDNDGKKEKKDDFLGSHTYYPGDPQPETVQVSGHGGIYDLKTVKG